MFFALFGLVCVADVANCSGSAQTALQRELVGELCFSCFPGLGHGLAPFQRRASAVLIQKCLWIHDFKIDYLNVLVVLLGFLVNYYSSTSASWHSK